jgi:phage terminase large subunit-like protein
VPDPFTLAHFRRWCSDLILDTGEPWKLEPFQGAFVRDVFAGFQENWLVIPEENAKTTLTAGLLLYHAQHLDHARAVVAASAAIQARWLYDAAAGFVERTPSLSRFRCQEGYLRILYPNGSRIQVFAADARTADGGIPTLAVCEELHRHRDLDLYRTWRGKLEKRGGQLVAISTAGDPEGEFEAVRKRIRDSATSSKRRGCYLRAVTGTTVLHEYAVPEKGNPDNLRTVKMANPLRAITVARLQRKKASPAMTSAHWRRFVCGMPARMDEWVTPAAWDGLKVDIGGLIDGEEVVVGLRVGAGLGVGIVAPREGERFTVGIRYLTAPEGGRVPFHEIEETLASVCETYDVSEIDYDPKQVGAAADILEERGFPMVRVPQTAMRLAPATATLWRLISAGLLMHDGDPELRRQVLAGRTKETLEGWRLDPTADTSALVALAMACHEASKGASPDPLIVLPAVG